MLTDKLFPIVEAMQKHFSAGSGTYYSDSIFFLSVAMHQIMPKGNLDCRALALGWQDPVCTSGLTMAGALFVRKAAAQGPP